MAEKAVLILGSNLGDREANLRQAERLIGERTGKVVMGSEIKESDPWGDVRNEDGSPAQGFLNRVLVVETCLEPDGLLRQLKAIEAEMGRGPESAEMLETGNRRYMSRIIDIDIIYYGKRVVDLPGLQIPHPLLAERAFVLEPIAEILPQSVHPVTGMTPGRMLERLKNIKICDR